MQNVYDFIVVGAGPAGSSAAEVLANGGAKVLVIERKKEVGIPVQCGEGITLWALRNIGMENGEWVKRVVDGTKLIMPNGKYIYKDEKMVSISRYEFDRELVERAGGNGVRILTGKNLTHIKKIENGYRLFTDKEHYESRYIIGADGPSSTVGKHLSAYESTSYVVSTVNRIKSREKRDFFEIYMSDSFPHGYGYIFPRDNHEYNIGIACKCKNVKAREKEILKKMGIEKKIFKGAGLIPLSFRMKYYSRDGIMLAGDAAGLANSVSYGGIYPAVISGRLAGEFGLKGMDNTSLFREYDSRIKSLDFYQKKPEKDHRLMYGLEEKDLNLMGEMINNRNFKDVSASEVLGFLIKKRRLDMLPRIFRIYRYFRKMSKYG